MAPGSSGRVNSGSKGFDFASDDILCSYEDYGAQDPSNYGDPDIYRNPSKDFQNSTSSYNLPEDSLSQEVFSAVEKGMKKHTDNIMRFLEGISSRLSQLELYCYNLDKSIGEMRSELNRDHEESESKLKFLEKHVQEVHRSVQILRDKQELADTQKELAKLQLAQKDSSSANHSQSNEERSSSPVPDSKKIDKASDQQLALALPHQVAPQQQPAVPTSQPSAQNVAQVNPQLPYYMTPSPFPNPPTVAQLPQNQYVPSDPQYRTPQPQMQDLSRVGQQVAQSQVPQGPPALQFPQYQQQQPWPQQLPQQIQPPQKQVRPPQHPSMQQPSRPTSNVYYPYPSTQPTNPSPQETLPSSMPMQMSYSGIPQDISSRADTVTYGYSGTGRPVAQPPPQPIKTSFSVPPGDAYGSTGPHLALPLGSAYMIYETDGGRTHPHQPPHFAQGGYQPTSASIQNPQASHNLVIRNQSQSQFYRSHPYSELIEKLVNMGCRSDHVANVIQRMEENRQPIDFNAVLDRLNVHSSVGPERPWSG